MHHNQLMKMFTTECTEYDNGSSAVKVFSDLTTVRSSLATSEVIDSRIENQQQQYGVYANEHQQFESYVEPIYCMKPIHLLFLALPSNESSFSKEAEVKQEQNSFRPNIDLSQCEKPLAETKPPPKRKNKRKAHPEIHAPAAQNRETKRRRTDIQQNEPFKCLVCSKIFTLKRNLTRHMIIHNGSGQYKCGVCKNPFSSNSSLKEHMRVHTGEKPFKCDVCAQSFSHKSTLEDHRRTHSGSGESYICNVCQKSYSHKQSLARHVRATHEGKSYKCNVCEKSFPYRDSLAKHARTHC